MTEMNYINRKDSLKTLISLRSGKISELEELLGKDRVRDFESLGYIVNGVSPSGETWKIGPSVNELYNTFYGDISIKEREANRLCNSIFNFKD